MGARPRQPPCGTPESHGAVLTQRTQREVTPTSVLVSRLATERPAVADEHGQSKEANL